VIGPLTVLIPVRAFGSAKGRLAPALDGPARAELARAMADTVVTAADPLPVAVVCDDREVADWARARGCLVIWEPGGGLNGAVSAGVAALAGAGTEQVIVAHADLPLARDLGVAAGFEGVTLFPDRHDDGTNVACVPAAAGFRFQYGPGSFRRHVDEAARLGLPLRIVRHPDLAVDVDVPADLAAAAPASARRGG
jgi:2-phospho-L-lactate guanylyltransferase